MRELAAESDPATPVIPRRVWTAVHMTAGAMLVVAALLKAYQGANATPNIALHLRLRELLLIEFELALGGLLLLNVWRVATWWVALATFTVFTGVSLNQALAGAKSCGCLGVASIDPRAMAAIDAAIVVMLFLAGPRMPSARPYPVLRRAGVTVLLALMVLTGATLAMAAIPREGLAALHSAEHDFGVISQDDALSREHTFVVRNTTRSPLRITGFRSSCGCTVVELPTEPIAPGQTAHVRVHADWSGVVGRTAARVRLQTDSRWHRDLALTVSAEVTR